MYKADTDEAEKMRLINKIIRQERLGIDTILNLCGEDQVEHVTMAELRRDMISAENVFLAAIA